MLIFVIAFNLSLTVLNLYVAYRLWRWRQYLVRVILTIERVDRYCDRIVATIPEMLLKGRSGSHALRQYYPQLGQSLGQLQSILGLINRGVSFYSLRRQKSI